MDRYYYGTSAYKLEEYENRSRNNNEKQKQRRKAAKRQQMALYRLMLVSVVFVFIAASALVYVNVMALRAASDIEDLEKELAMVVDNNKQKEIKINQSLDMKNIEKRAIEELGMQKPDNSQIVYVDVRKENFVKVAGENKVAAASYSQGIKGFFKSIWEYFN